MIHAGVFSGIGGFDLAAQWMGWENKFHCEWNEFGQRVLKYYWPKAISYEDITKTDFTIHRGKIDILSGGFPCQPFSNAGKRKGEKDDRYLWPEMLRCIDEIRPSWVVAENVTGLGSMVFDKSIIRVESQAFMEETETYRTLEGESIILRICEDLENIGYDVQPIIIPACALNAPHRRDRIWFIAVNTNRNTNKQSQNMGGKNTRRFSKSKQKGVFQGTKYKCFGIGNLPKAVTNSQESNKQRNGVCEKQQERKVGRQDSRVNKKGVTSYSTSNGQPEKETINRREEHEQKRNDIQPIDRTDSNNWNDFPTQPPICGGNDGLPSELDGITFPNWRNESIKGYGNAIVPQVAYEIFKAIQEIECT